MKRVKVSHQKLMGSIQSIFLTSIDVVIQLLKPDDNMIAIKERFLKIKSMIAEYNEFGDKMEINRASMITSPITVKDIILLPFNANIKEDEEEEKAEGSDDSSPVMKRTDARKYNSYLSTPRFIKYLTDISELIAKEPNKKNALKRELRKLNQHLPASVYIPFFQESLRNYAVLHIPPEEVAVFQTKTRAPYMITIEIYRPEEMSIQTGGILSEKKHSSSMSKTSDNRKKSRKESLDLSDYEEPLIQGQTDDIFNMQRGKSNSVYHHSNTKIDLAADKKISNPLFISFAGGMPDTRGTLRETMKNQNKAEKKVKKFLLDSQDNDSITEENVNDENGENENEDEEENAVQFEEVKDKYRKFSDLSSNRSESFASPRKLEPLEIMKSKTGETPGRVPASKHDESVNYSGSQSKRRNSDTSNYYKNDLNEVLSQRKEEEINFNRDKRFKSESKIVKTPTNFLFKETFDQQSERLRKSSIFGSLKTWRICKIIVKSGDDLRQEQLAMQLIDSMSQIFQVCEIDLWLKPYEILATGDG
jgi:phosphatidylinositol 4-kinase